MMPAKRLPKPPEGYRPATALERRLNTTQAALENNRRLGWMLQLAARYKVVPKQASFAASAKLVRLLLPDLFPADIDALPFVKNTDDLDLAIARLDDPRWIDARQLIGRPLRLAVSEGVTLEDLTPASLTRPESRHTAQGA